MSKDPELEQDEQAVSRRAMLAGGAGLAALSASTLITGCDSGQSRGDARQGGEDSSGASGAV